ncbi:GNAT family N-acetyltransferase [Desulfopila sp. IMCC35008]|uniref:GNAT family N-acetyltransferase n=1 Tax=Desulfopila sp. IMCC35008 TaxID=2653858 RepID=UPI0013D5E11D|nr:GNAT family N-acetyltransferase [Desulfopila sp. IMCC35008]
MKVHCGNSPSTRAYRKLIAGVYKNNPCHRDSLTDVYNIVTSSKGAFGSRCHHSAITVTDENDEVLAFCLLIHAKHLADTLQISFFEAQPHCAVAVKKLVDAAQQIAIEKGVKRIIAGMNGHVNYGLGFLTDSFDKVPCFGSAFNPPYYAPYFLLSGFKKFNLVSYQYEIDNISMVREEPILRRLEKRFTFRKTDFSKLKEEISLYTELNNLCFKGHPLYFPRLAEEDYELFHPFRWFLNEDNLLIAEHNGQPIAFILWYPDYNELIGPGEKLGIKALLRYRVFRQQVTRLKIAEIGVVPEYQGSGVLLGLFHHCFRLARDKFSTCETGWIFDSNDKSKNICQRWQPTPSKNYAVFSMDV